MVFYRFMTLVALLLAPSMAFAESSTIGAHGLRLPASFTGTLPCADCDGIAYHLDLWPNQSYHMRRKWLKDEEPSLQRDELGRWYADPARQAILLYGASEMPIQWQVKGPDRLRQLDREGQPIDSDLNYELTSDGSLNETDLEGLFVGGMMTYLADAAIFEDCMTGRTYPIAQEGAYLALEEAYLAAAPGPGAPLYVHVEGGLLMRPAMEGPDRRSLVVSRFIKTRPGITCERQKANASLINTYWRIDNLAGENIAEVLASAPNQREPHIVLQQGDKNNLAATVGCNRMRGSYNHGGATLSFGPMAATMMACPPPLDKLEQALGETLARVQSYKINGETLVLYDGADTPVANLTAVYLQ